MPVRTNDMPLRVQLASPSNGKGGRPGTTIKELLGTHAFELKIDGIRGLMQWDGTDVTIWNRNGVVVTGFFPEVVENVRSWNPPAFLLDGELDLVRPGHSFNDVCVRIKGSEARAARLATEDPMAFVAFDVLHLDGLDLVASPYTIRRDVLEMLVGHHRRPAVTVVPSGRDGLAMWDVVYKSGGEGLIAKRLASRYHPGKRSPEWLKFKTTRRLTCVAIGYDPGEGARAHFGAMHIAVIDVDAGKPQYVGRVGTGFNEHDIQHLKGLLDGGQMPLVEIECLGRTQDGKLRFPVYLGPRTDQTLLDASSAQLDALPIQ